ncbi:MAG: YkgJ family cysteine cluster protein [Chloroherpetonaceae bacterium]|nr:YkgJ family cysteine cluster protein [Chloroherpetonaceae bacterium]MDW8438696.1 YkgJ family cysteine cluster protein [Chloroherpetonaceae bacterium]
MRDVFLDLSLIEKQAKEKESENLAFAKFLRRFPSKTLDALVERLNARIEPLIDCKACANCCKRLRAVALETELPALANAKGVSVEAFKQTFVQPYKEGFYFKSSPCPMLRADNRCEIYDARPACCRTFPNLVGEHFKYRFKSVMEKYPICPIAFHVVEALKTELDFPKNSDI